MLTDKVDLNEKLNVCKWWLMRGWRLLPAQPNSKYLIAGFGEHKNHIVNIVQAEEVLDRFPSCNLAVLRGQEKTILDFDDVTLYESWVAHHPDESVTYTERTPRGGAHVFADCPTPNGLIWMPGVESKKICLIYPSVVDGKQYSRGDYEILTIDEVDFFSGLSLPGTRTAYILKHAVKKKERMPYGSSSVIEQIKHHFTVEDVYARYRPASHDFISKTREKDMYLGVLCPFHDDHKPSLTLDLSRQLYSCFSCGAHGDVINLYMFFENLPLREAIAKMAKELQG